MRTVKTRLLFLSFIVLLLGGLAFWVIGGRPAQEEKKVLTVMAAISLKQPFEELAGEFARQHPGVAVRFNFDGTQRLRAQLERGAPADVFAAANLAHMESLQKQGLVPDYTVFARNRLVLVVPENNPAGIDSVDDLVKPHRLVLAAPDVPAGGYARQVLHNLEEKLGAGYSEQVLANLLSEETNVKSVLTKVALGEADAGFVYATDAAVSTAGAVRMLEIPDAANIRAEYYIAPVAGARQPEPARLFVDFVVSESGQELLRKYGF